MPVGEDDPSIRLLNILRDANIDRFTRERAFEELLNLPSGWWGNQRLIVFVRGVALAETRRRLVREGADRVDWEGLADEALVIFFDAASKMTSEPRAFLWGIVKNLVRHEICSNWPEISADELTDIVAEQLPRWVPIPEADETALVLQEQEADHLAVEDELLRAVSALPPALRIVVQLVLIEHMSPEDVCAQLQIKPTTFRKRFQRAREALQAAVLKTEKMG